MLKEYIFEIDSLTTSSKKNYEDSEMNTLSNSPHNLGWVYSHGGSWKKSFQPKPSGFRCKAYGVNMVDKDQVVVCIDDSNKFDLQEYYARYFSNEEDIFEIIGARNRRQSVLSKTVSILQNDYLSVGTPHDSIFDINSVDNELASFKFIKSLEIEEKSSSPDKTLDFIYQYFDKLLQDNKFDACNAIIEKINISELKEYSLVGLLTITLAFKSQLPYRSSFYKKVRKYFELIYSTKETNNILKGLE